MGGVKSRGCSSCSLMVRVGGAMVPEAPRMVQKPVMQATPKAVQKEGGGETVEAECPQKSEKGFPVLELISFNRSRHHVFPPTRGTRQSMSGQRRQGISPKTKGVSAAAWEYSLRSLSRGRLTTDGSSYSH